MAKHHNWVTGPKHKVVDIVANRMAVNFICGCNHLTPAAEAQLDNLFAAMNRNAPEKDADNMVCESDPEFLATLETPDDDYWMDDLEPPAEAFEYEKIKARR